MGPESVVSEVLATATDLTAGLGNLPTSLPVVPVTALPSSIVSEILATATGLPADASNIPLTNLPSDIQTAVSSAIANAVPVTRLPSSVVSEILATATDLAGDATNIPVTAVPSGVLFRRWSCYWYPS